jgi:ketol-acid reductoisomerase
LECCHELKQIADLVYEYGPAGMTRNISNTAEFGAYEAGPRLIDEHIRRRMRELLDEIRSGEFARRLQGDHQHGFRWFHAQQRARAGHPIEAAAEFVRSLMPQPGIDSPGMAREGGP